MIAGQSKFEEDNEVLVAEVKGLRVKVDTWICNLAHTVQCEIKRIKRIKRLVCAFLFKISIKIKYVQ